MYRLGVDVGGTNTDAVVMCEGAVIHACKTPTTSDVMSGVVTALKQVIEGARISSANIDSVMIGTTHFTNALVERRGLAPVGAIRLALPATDELPPLSGWPADLIERLRVESRIAHGGYEFDGRELSALRPDEIRAYAAQFAAAGIRHIAISGVFSPINHEQERVAAALVREVIPDACITMSCEIGRIGLLERENAAILNATLGELGPSIAHAFERALEETGIGAPFFLTQNDGTLMSAQRTARFPILTVASGPTNSMRGAAHLSRCSNAVVVDIGGTTSDVGILQNGFPRQAGMAVEVGGVRTNFRMPDVCSIALGGGSVVSADLGSIGPHSVGFRLAHEGRVFGGDVLTATDVAVAGGRACLGDACRVAGLDAQATAQCLSRMEEMIFDAIERMRISAETVPVLVVGGGSVLLRDRIGDLNILVPPHFGVANAVGAAMAQVSGECDRVVKLTEISRELAIDQVRGEAQQRAIDAGAARAGLSVVDIEDVPLAYLPGNATRLRVRVVGDLDSARHGSR